MLRAFKMIQPCCESRIRPALSSCKTFFLWTTVGSLLSVSQSMAEEDVMIEGGKEIFQREWVYESPALAELTDDMDPLQSAQSLRNLPGDGLGPMHNATSCESCHAAGGGAGIDRNVTLLTLDPRISASFTTVPSNQAQRNRIRNALLDLYPGLISPAGVLSMDVVLHEQSARPFYEGIRDNVGKHVPGGAPDRWFKAKERTIEAIAQRPVLAGRHGELDFYLSQRNSPPLFGLGLIDRIEMSRLRLLAVIQNRKTKDGVSGRVGAGKFGWRAQTSTLDLFVRGACAGELGLQLSRTPQPPDAADDSYLSPGIDLEEHEVRKLVSYVSSLPRPIQETRLPEDQIATREGKKLFATIGCSTCHVEHIHPARGIFSDLLLHDMGELLQAPAPAPLGSLVSSVPRMSIPRFPPEDPLGGPSAPRGGFGFSLASYYGTPSNAIPNPYPMARPSQPRFPRGRVPSEVINTTNPRNLTWDALQREWRTPPLWGVADSAPYLHDGRAATLDAAIRWHGGEASQSITRYRTLEKEDREKVIAFLASLRAPATSIRQEVDDNVGLNYVSAEVRDANQLQKMAEAISVFD